MVTRNFSLLLPPSEGKADGGLESQPWSTELGVFGEALHKQRTQIVVQLKKLNGGDSMLLGVKGVHLERATVSNKNVKGAPTLPAWQRYTGVVWDHLNLASLPATSRASATRRIFIPSGLLGLVRADDLIPDYRLKMGARLAPFGTLNKWWRDAITEALQETAKKNVLVDLLPQEHRAAIDWESIPNALRVDLVSKKGAVVGGHNAKAAKGLLAQHLLVTKGQDIRSMVSSFKHPDYVAKVST